MVFFPTQSEVLILPFTSLEVEKLLQTVTKAPNEPDEIKAATQVFNGSVDSKSFSISRKVDHPENYLPLIKGKIEGTAAGCILFVGYGLFFSSKLFLVFWSALSLLFGVCFVVFDDLYGYAALSWGLGAFNYLVTYANFNIQVEKSKAQLNGILAAL